MNQQLERLVDSSAIGYQALIFGKGRWDNTVCLEPFSYATVPLGCWYENEPEQDCPHYFYRRMN